MSDALSVVLRHYDALNDRDFETYAALLSEDVLATVNGSPIRGREAMMDVRRRERRRAADDAHRGRGGARGEPAARRDRTRLVNTAAGR